MKKTILMLHVALCLAGSLANAADLRIENPQLYAELRDMTFAPLFEALHAGDVAMIKRYLRGETSEQYRVLFEQNKEYGHFLRDYYAGARFELSQVVPAGNDYIADVLINWPAGNTSVIKLQVSNTPPSYQGSSMQWARPGESGQRRWNVGQPVERSGKKQNR